jgi:glycosyltransferase involved in cell wall biosynthesis
MNRIRGPLSIFFLVRSLEVGGAERQLAALAIKLRERGHKVRVGVFYRRGELAADLERCEVEIVDLGKTGRWDVLGFLVRTIRMLRACSPDVIYSFLGGANIVAAAVRPFVPRSRLVWSIRSSNMDLTKYDWLHRATFRLECAMSRMPDLIIANSRAGRDFASASGFPVRRIEIVPNGIDTDRFRPDQRLRKVQRRRWGITDEQIAVGVVARLDPMKDHATFLRAAAQAGRKHPQLRFLCIGEGVERPRLQALSSELGIDKSVAFTGFADPAAAFNALDMLCSSSITEGFPNAVAEAMACGVSCIVTDAGDSAQVVGESGDVVPVGDPETLASAILRRATLSTRATDLSRKFIIENFSLEAMVDRTIRLLLRLA